MIFAIIIEISRKNIAFRYFRDDAGSVFHHFDENVGSMPLAIYCQDDDLQIGAYALSEAEKHSQYAWKDIFDVVKQNRTFRYRGQDINMNELLLVAIKKYLADFFDKILVKTMGTLEANISTMPLMFLFHPDVDKSDRLFVIKTFRDGGFVNLAAIDLDCEIVKKYSHQKKLTNKKVAITVFPAGNDLIVSSINIANLQYVKSIRIVDKGVDPREKLAVDKLWDSMGYYSYGLQKENEYSILRGLASAFLASDEFELQRRVLFSDGQERLCYLDKNQLNGIDLGTDGKIKNDILNLIHQSGAQENNSVIILCGTLAYSSYFIDNAKVVGTDVIVDKDPEQQSTLKDILEYIIERKFHIGNAPVDTDLDQGKPLGPSESIAANRILRTVQHMTPQQGQIELLNLELRLKKINPAPSDLQQYLDRIKEALETIKSTEIHVNSKPPVTRPVPQQPAGQNVSLPLSIGETKAANDEILKTRSMAPDEALKHLDKLLKHIEGLHPSNMKMWSNRINAERLNAKKRFEHMPKKVDGQIKAPHNDNRNKIGKALQQKQREVKRVLDSVVTGVPKTADKAKKISQQKAQEIFTKSFGASFKLSNSDAIKKLTALEKELHILGIHKYDFQIESRIEMLQKK